MHAAIKNIYAQRLNLQINEITTELIIGTGDNGYKEIYV